MSTVGFEGFLQSIVCAGMSPVSSMFDLIIQVKHLLSLKRLVLVMICHVDVSYGNLAIGIRFLSV